MHSVKPGRARQSGRRPFARSFLADEMLGKLVRFMRVMGLQTRHASGMDDSEILRLAMAQRLVLLTQDGQLEERAKVREIPCMFVPAASPERQIAAILSRFRLKLPKFPSSTLCPVCGAKLARAKKSEVAGKVHARVLQRRRLFWRCKQCGKIYWSGTHYARLRRAYLRVKRMARTA
jgi:uncharacterized protein with PIN domain